MREQIEELEQNIHIDEKTSISHLHSWREDTCWTVWGVCPGGTYFDETRKMLSPFNTSIFIKRDVIRRVRNVQSSNAVSLRNEKSTITVDTTTSGWSITAEASTGSWNPVSGGSKGLSISGGYSSSTTTGQTLSVSESSSMTCPPRHRCWAEAWTAYARVKGKCQLEPKVTCYESVDNMCLQADSGNHWFFCANIQEYRDKPGVCNGLEGVIDDCEVVTPIMDGKKPFFVEVFFEEPIKSLYPKPEITGYQSGYYILDGDGDYRYFPTRVRDPFWTPEAKYHANAVYPRLDDEVAKFKHPVPTLETPEPIGDCYKLITLEYYCPRQPKKYWSKEVGVYYDKPTAPEPDLTGAKPIQEGGDEGGEGGGEEEGGNQEDQDSNKGEDKVPEEAPPKRLRRRFRGLYRSTTAPTREYQRRRLWE
ncbi:hypothetical protein CP533_0589 [Ophiocordyceps camponoti-saundersi (nom. inval.)]|nr:hypothetical protein CP533_0589 [Ophiocordyceps camponoti-saundersi (nom. inval.)]